MKTASIDKWVPVSAVHVSTATAVPKRDVYQLRIGPQSPLLRRASASVSYRPHHTQTFGLLVKWGYFNNYRSQCNWDNKAPTRTTKSTTSITSSKTVDQLRGG